MPQNMFKIFDGRTHFWQWDTKQKLIVLDDQITEVRFSNRNMEHTKRRIVYTENGIRVCNVPDVLLQLPKNLVAYACIKQEDGSYSTVKSVKFAVAQQPIPENYVCEQDAVIENILKRLELLEETIKEIERGTQEMKKFESMEEAAIWAKENAKSGIIITVKTDGKWVPYIVEDDYSLSPICNCDGEMITLTFDGDDADGIQPDEIDENTLIYHFDGGSASGIK